MLVKKELMTVPIQSCPKEFRKQNYFAAAQIATLPKSGRILTVDFFQKGSLLSRFYSDGKNYIVWREAPKLWGSGYPVPGCSGYYTRDIQAENLSAKIVSEYLPEESEGFRRGIEAVFSFIYHKNSEQRDRARENMYALMDRHMAMFPAYPQNLKEYCNAQVFDHGYIFIAPKDKKGVRMARCSCCGKMFQVEKDVVSGRKTTCPSCGAKATTRGMWIKSDVEDKADICICYKVDGQLLIRWTHIVRRYGWPDFKEQFSFDDFAYSLYIVANGEPRIYTYKYFKAPYGYEAEWHRLPLGSTCDSSSFVYTDTLDEVFGEHYYNVDLKAGLAGKRISFQFVSLLNNLKNIPKAEYLFKMGLPLLASSAQNIQGNPDGKGKFMQEVGVSKQYLPLYREMNVTPMEHHMIRESSEWITANLLQQYRDFGCEEYGAFSELIKKLGISRTISYIEKQYTLHPKMTPNKIAIEFRDYLSMSHALKVDMSHKSVRFPADVIEAHRIITERHNAALLEIEKEKRKEENEKFSRIAQQLYEQYHISEYRNDPYCVVFPKLRTDLIAEGQSLNHCVGLELYAKNHIEGRYMIFFIRKIQDPGKPYFTMELDMQEHRIKQLYGFGDCTAPKEVRAFAEKFVMYTKKAMNRRIA